MGFIDDLHHRLDDGWGVCSTSSESTGLTNSSSTTCQSYSKTVTRAVSPGIIHSYSYGGPPHLVRRWILRDQLRDFLAEETDESLTTAIRHLLVLL